MLLHKSDFKGLLLITALLFGSGNCSDFGSPSKDPSLAPVAVEPAEFTPRANPLPKPSTMNWSAHDSRVYLAAVPNNLTLQLPKMEFSSLLNERKNHRIMAAAVDRTLARIYSDKWVPQALAGPPPRYKKFPKYRGPVFNASLTLETKNNTSVLSQRYSQSKTPRTSTYGLTKRQRFGNFGHLFEDNHVSKQQALNVDNFEQLASSSSQNKKAPNFEKSSHLKTIVIEIESMGTELKQGINETYTLNVTFSVVKIQSATIWGALHALSTFEQLVEWDKTSGRPFVERQVYIADRPLYSYRGVLLDTARNFYTIDSILRQLDAMALSKLNIFHWHLVDTQSWPLELAVSYPEMSLDAYSPVAVYSAADVRHVVQYGYFRGVRVVPEIDMPAHANSGWRRVHPGIITCADSFWNGYGDDWDLHTAVQPTPGHLDILHPETLKVVERVYNEVSDLFPDNFFHVGLDEIVPNCYNYSEYVSEWFRANESRTYRDLVQYWVDHALPIFLKIHPDRKLVMWEDVILSKTSAVHNLSTSSVVIQSWMGGKANVEMLLSKGYDVIVSSADFFYLDCGAGGFITNDPRYAKQEDPSPGKPSFNYHGPGGSWCAPYKTWQRIYSYDFPKLPVDNNSSGSILGATVNLWSEQSDSAVVDSKLWPRAAALAELVWSGNRDPHTGARRTSEFTQRIINFRERLVLSRGICAEVLVPRYCITRPHSCDLTMAQHELS
jgi:hexosaminidase